MVPFQTASALLLLCLLTGCAAVVGDVGPAQAPAADGTGLPGSTMASTEAFDEGFSALQPSARVMGPGTYGTPEVSPSFGPPPFPTELDPGAVLPPLYMRSMPGPCLHMWPRWLRLESYVDLYQTWSDQPARRLNVVRLQESYLKVAYST